MENDRQPRKDQTPPGRLRSLPRWTKISAGIVLAILIYTLMGFLVVPAVGRMIAVAQLQKRLQRSVVIEKIRFNPYTLTARIQNFRLSEPDGKTAFISFRELYLNLQSISLFRLAPVLKEIRLNAPVIYLTLAKDGHWNFADLKSPPPPATAADEPQAEDADSDPFRFSLNNIQIRDGRIRFHDGVRHKNHIIEKMDIDLPFLSNLKTAVDIFVKPQFAATINGTPLALKGSTKPFADSLETELDIDLRAIELAEYMPYLPADTAFVIQSGRLDVKVHLTYIHYPDGSFGLRSAGTLNLNDLTPTDPENLPLLTFDRLHIDIGSLEPLAGIVRLNTFDLQQPVFTITRLPTDKVVRTSEAVKLAERFRQINIEPPLIRLNRLNVEEARVVLRDLKSAVADDPGPTSAEHVMLAVPQLTVNRIRVSIPDQKIEVAAVTSTDGRMELRRLADGVLNLDVFIPPPSPETPGAAPAPAAARWQVDVEKVDIGGYAVQGINLVPDDPATLSIDAIQLAAIDLTNRPDVTNRVDLAGRINTTGTLDTRTEWKLAPLAVDTRIELQQLDLAALYPFIKPYVAAVLTDGRLSVQGDLRLAAGADEIPGLSARFQGSAGLSRFHTIDRLKAEPLVGWNDLQLAGIDVGYQPTYLKIRDIILEKPSGHLRIDTGGQINLMAAADPNTGSPPKEEAPTADAGIVPPPVTIGRIFIKNGDFRFIDRSFRPGFETTFDRVEARVINLSTEAAQPAEVLLAGRVDNLTPLEISGQIRPRPEDLFVDLKINLRQMDLTAISPYSGRFIGKKISKGKLSADLVYKVAQRKLSADHGIRIDQFDFGSAVASEEALDLPVDLAVALLQDRNGRIQINLPVSGDMDDPEFSIGGIVLQAFLNLIAKAATAPFSLIGAMFDGQDLDYLEFDAGRSLLTPATTQKLDGLAGVLYERPVLQLEISGFADNARDTPVLTEIMFQNKLKARKILARTKKKLPAEELGNITVTPEEYPVYLQEAYEAESFPKPRNLLGFAKTLPPEEAERLMRKNIEIRASDLEKLALARAKAVRDHLLQSGRVETGRIFLVKTDNALAPEALAGISPSRVELGLK
ncbi:MAG: DUF748 domain-containing protein [Desulfosarcina sp.]|nr:DUF748 domain-containing protein [Desulfobacterales bacterium]